MSDEIIFGINPVSETLRGSRKVHELFTCRETSDRRMDKLCTLAQTKGVPIRVRSKTDLTRLCGSEFHQGVALRVDPFIYAELDDVMASWRESGQDGLVLVLDGIQDPHNLGALIRTAACADTTAVIIPKDRAVGITATVEKASAGAVETIPIVRVTNVVQTLQQLKDAGFWVYAAADDAPNSIYRQSLLGHVALVIGNEGEGIRPLVRKACDLTVSIPLTGGVQSLNASVAGGVILFEIVRQRLAAEASRTPS